MLAKWGLSNFKSFLDKTEIDLAPLTVLTGANSSGKSTILQSMLLIAQTLRNPISSRELVLNGPLVKMGYLSDIQSVFTIGAGISFSFNNLNIPDMEFDEIKYSLLFSAVNRNMEAVLNSVTIDCFKDNLNIGGLIATRKNDDNSLIIKNLTGVLLREAGFLVSFIQGIMVFPHPHFLLREHRLPDIDSQPPYWLSEFNNFLTNYFTSSFKYLGSLRYLDPVFPFSAADDPKDVGMSGEYTASVIFTFSKCKVEYYVPDKKDDNQNGVYSFNKKTESSLDKALCFWLDYFGLKYKISVSSSGAIGYELSVVQQNSDREAIIMDISQAGAGISQVLPVLVMCLLAEKNSTLLFEHPEIHLYPKVQSRLADFFLCMALSGKQCIIETHSEHFINRLRMRISDSLQNDDMTISGSSKIYFFDKKGSYTKVMPIETIESF